MEYRILETELVLRDLDRILSYMTEALANPSAAASFADAVELCYGMLERMPFAYEQCGDSHLSALGYRKAVIDHYIMIYRVAEEEQIVYILRFFYGRQDYEKLI